MFRKTILYSTLMITVLLAAGLEAFACPKQNNGFPGATDLLERNFPGPQPLVTEWTLTLGGAQSQGSADGDTCAAAIALPLGFYLLSVEVVDPDTGELIPEFETFQHSSVVARHLNRGLLPYPRIRYQAFASTVRKVDPDRPMNIRFIFAFRGETAPSDLAVANMLVQQSLVVTGGADEQMVPNHHVSVESIGRLAIKGQESR